MCNRLQGRKILNYTIVRARECKNDPLSPFYKNKLGTRCIAAGNHLSSSETFESGVVKIQNGREDNLTAFEERACESLLKANDDVAPVKKPSTLAQLIEDRKRKAQDVSGDSKYQADHVLASTSCVERHWSVADTILTK